MRFSLGDGIFAVSVIAVAIVAAQVACSAIENRRLHSLLRSEVLKLDKSGALESERKSEYELYRAVLSSDAILTNEAVFGPSTELTPVREADK